ncbi:MAG TPA: hypothetical protein VK683_04935 [Rhizomicrobium sp.]|jgi:hypothetical protein|nr:hypothetical protein [Rhizomicrobium sp.]
MNAPRAHVTTGKASLVGGIVVGIACLVLWLAVTRELGFGGLWSLGAGLLVAAAAGTWTRLADL